MPSICCTINDYIVFIDYIALSMIILHIMHIVLFLGSNCVVADVEMISKLNQIAYACVLLLDLS